jgi:predicted glycogen debranching enzyme
MWTALPVSRRSAVRCLPPPAGFLNPAAGVPHPTRDEEGRRMATISGNTEWLETDGLGGFASGTVSGIRTRRYHALLLAATSSGRRVLVNGVEAWVAAGGEMVALTSHRYEPGVTHPDGALRLEEFSADAWPRWVFRLPDGRRVVHEVLVPHGSSAVALSWRLLEGGSGSVALRVRLLASGRDYHATHHENAAFRFSPREEAGALVWSFYDGVPPVAARATGAWEQRPEWYRRFLYEEERARGLDDTEDLASPGAFLFDLREGEAVLLLEARHEESAPLAAGEPRGVLAALRDAERRRRTALGGPLERAGDAYLIRSRGRRTIIAGYPWFTDWGRDTFIALRGLCLATGRREDARDILLSWAPTVSEGMLPNLFPDGGAPPEFNSVDASLWYVIAAGEYMREMASAGQEVSPHDRQMLTVATAAILKGYASGTRHGIHADRDGLLASGAPRQQLTWMDARVGDWVVTPRRGKPVEVQALWLNALAMASIWNPSSLWDRLLEQGRASFVAKFWNEQSGALHDVIDVEGESGRIDASFRPNQILAVGGLPLMLLDKARARRLVDAVEARLATPLGLRSLAPGESGYAPRYTGGPHERDAVYHQGTVWPWLAGPFVEAWVRVRGDSTDARREARERFLRPLLAAATPAAPGHLPEIADAEAPHTSRGCPFQAWSVGEALRLDRAVLAVMHPTAPAMRRSGTGAAAKPAPAGRHLKGSRP